MINVSHSSSGHPDSCRCQTNLSGTKLDWHVAEMYQLSLDALGLKGGNQVTPNHTEEVTTGFISSQRQSYDPPWHWTKEDKLEWVGTWYSPTLCVVPVKHNTGLFTEGKKKLDLLRNSTHRDNNKTLFHCAYTHTYLTSTSAACYCHLMQPKIHSFTIMLTQYRIMRLDNWIITFDRYVVSEQ